MDALYDKIKALRNGKLRNVTNKNDKGIYRKIEENNSEYKYMYVAKKKYIFGEYQKYFILIDAKGAYEYLLFNRLLKEWRKHKRISCKPLLMPISIRLHNINNISKKITTFLKKFGIFIVINRNKEILISKLPKSVHYYLYEDFIKEILNTIEKDMYCKNITSNYNRCIFNIILKYSTLNEFNDEQSHNLFDKLKTKFSNRKTWCSILSYDYIFKHIIQRTPKQ